MFGRLLNVKIRNDEGSQIILVDSEQGEYALRCSVSIDCVPNKEKTSAIIKIINLDKYTYNTISTGKYRYITVEFGYKDLNGGAVSSIFEGTLHRMIVQRKSPETSVAIFYAYELGDVYSYGMFSGSFESGTSIYNVLKTIATEGTEYVPIVISNSLKNYALNEPLSIYEGQMSALQKVANSVNNVLFMHSMGKVYVTTTLENENSPVIAMSGVDSNGVLKSASGLIGLPTLEDDGLSFECLVNPMIHIYSMVLIANEFISEGREGFERSSQAGAVYDENGLYVVMSINTYITNGPEESKMSIRALARKYFTEDNNASV